MSKPYRIRVQDVVTAQDYSTFHIDPVPLVTPSAFSHLMSEVLAENGWSTCENKQMQLESEDGALHTFDPEKMEITTILESEEQIDRTLDGYERGRLEQKAKEIVEQREDRLNEEVTNRLEDSLNDRRLQFEEMVVEATGRALKDAAERLGDVQQIHEERGEGGKYRLTITVQERE